MHVHICFMVRFQGNWAQNSLKGQLKHTGADGKDKMN